MEAPWLHSSHTHKNRTEWWFLGTRGWGLGELLINGYSFNYARRRSSNNHLCNQEPIDNNTVLCTSKYVKRLDLMLSVLITHTQKHKEKRKCLGVTDMFSSLIVVMVSWRDIYVYIYIYMSKLIKMYTLNVWIFCINYTSIKCSRKRKTTAYNYFCSALKLLD